MANSLESSGFASPASSSASTPSNPVSSTTAAPAVAPCARSLTEGLSAHGSALRALALDAHQLTVLIGAVSDHYSGGAANVLLGLAEKLATALRDGMDASAMSAERLALVGRLSLVERAA